MPLEETLRSIEKHLDDGRVDAAAKQRKPLAAECNQLPPEDRTACFARARAADLALMMLDLPAADAVLAPYLSIPDARCTDLVATLRDLPRAAVESACANSLYRHREYKAARELVDLALKRFAVLNKENPAEPGVQLGFMWTLAYAARIAWRAPGTGQTLERYIDRCLRMIERNRGKPWVNASRLASLEAFILDLRAFTLWLLGDVPSAMASAYRSLTLLSGRSVDVEDRARRAQALLTAGRIQATLSDQRRYRDAYALLDESVTEFTKIDHPLQELAKIERVRLIIRSGDLDLASAKLESLSKSKTNLVLASEYDLTRCWLAQADRDTSRAPANATIQMEHAQFIVDNRKALPRRLALEGSLQLGMAQVAAGDVKKGIATLSALREEASKLGRERVEAACLLELTEACQQLADERVHVQRHFAEANAIIARASSAYLLRRRREVGRQRQLGWFVHIKSEKYVEASHTFNREFFTRAQTLYGKRANIQRRTGAHLNTIRSWTEEDVRPRPGRGRRGKTAGDPPATE